MAPERTGIIFLYQQQLLLFSFLFVLVCYGITYLLCPPMWDYYGGAVAHMINGSATYGELTDTYIYGFFHINKLFVWLHHKYPRIPSAGIAFNLIYIGCYVAIIRYFLWHYRQHYTDSIPCWLLLLFYLLMQPIISQPTITGHAFMLATTALLYAYHFINQPQFLPNIGKYLILLILYILAFIVLLEPAVAGSAIILGYLLLFHNPRTKHAVIFLPFIIAGVCVVIVVTSSLREVPFLYHMEQKLFYVGDGVNDFGIIQQLTPSDAVKYEALHSFFLSDEGELNEIFIDKIYKLKKALQAKQSTDLSLAVQQAWQVSKRTILSHWHYLFLLSGLLFSCFYKEKRYVLSLFFYSACFFAVLFFLAYSLKLEARHYVLLCQVFIVTLIIYLVTYKLKTPTPKWLRQLAFWWLIGMCICRFYELNEKRTPTLITLQNISKTEQEINVISKDKKLVLDSYSIALFHGTPYTVRQINKPKSIIYYDFGQMVILPQYNRFLDKSCSCNALNPVAFYNWLQSESANTIFVSSASRLQFIEKYMRIVHHKEIKFKKIEGYHAISKVTGEGQQLAYFKIDSVY